MFHRIIFLLLIVGSLSCNFNRYADCFQSFIIHGLPTVAEHHHNICTRTFESIMSDPNHKLRKLLPPVYKSRYNLRHAHTSTLPRCKTNRFKNSFLGASGRIANNFQVSYCTFLVLAITIITHFYHYQYTDYYHYVNTQFSLHAVMYLIKYLPTLS